MRPAYHRLRVAEVVEETAQARSLVLSVPPDLAPLFAYRPGQFLTVRVPSGAARCYSLSSSPHTDRQHTITVKRVPDGHVSNWICDHVRPGCELDLLPPAGSFTPASLDDDLLLLAAGSGITPVMSIVKSVLCHGRGRLAVHYANRDAGSVIFGAELADLAAGHPGRLSVTHWYDATRGPPDVAALRMALHRYAGREAFVCGPPPYLAIACQALAAAGVPDERVHVERFESTVDAPGPVAGEPGGVVEVTLDGQTRRLPWPPGARLLDVLIDAGLNPPYSCRQGTCGACACRVLRGTVELVRNEILEDEDFADGYTLACQALSRSAEVAVSYSP